MADERINSLFNLNRFVHIGDPPIILEFINDLPDEAKQSATSLYLGAVAEGLQAHLKLVQGLRSIISSSANR